jgi:hypothetical protein
MKVGKIISVALALIIVAGCLITSRRAANEPAYQNRKLSEWLRDFEDASHPQTQALAADAIRHIGTAALPVLVDRLSEDKERQFEAEIKKWREKQSNETDMDSVSRPPSPRSEALSGLDALDSEATPALPVLEELLREEKNPDPRILYAVARIGPASVPFLIELRTNEMRMLSLGAGVCLDLIASRSEVLYPAGPVGPEAPSFERRLCEFNLKIVEAAGRVYRAEHSELPLPDQSIPVPVPPK